MLEYQHLIDVYVDYMDGRDGAGLEKWVCEETEVTPNALILHRASGANGFAHIKVGIPLNNVRNWVERIPNT